VVVPVMEVGHVRVRMLHRLVHVLVGVGLGPLVAAVGVLVMLIVDVTVAMCQVMMLVFVPM
jgi:hypothetical protein